MASARIYTINRAALLGLLFVLAGCTARNIAPANSGEAPREPEAPVVSLSPDDLILDLLRSRPDKFQAVIDNPEKYETQIIYTQINRVGNAQPQFRHFGYRVNPKAYFNPASLVKLPVACLALQKINQLRIPGLDADTRLAIAAEHPCQSAVTVDKTAPRGFPSVGHYIRKALVVSDNDAYNRLYEFLGQEYINTALWRMGYPTARIIRRFNGCDADENRYTNPILFYGESGSIMYRQPPQFNAALLSNPLGAVFKGKGHIDRRGRYVARPFDYTYHNYISLQDIHTLLQSLFFPQSFPEQARFQLTEKDYALLRQCLSSLPGESGIPAYQNSAAYPENYKKYFLFGDAADGRITDESVRIFNVVGQSDGYLSDCAYIKDTAGNSEFFLSAVIYVNNDGVIKDGNYEYATTGLPFLAELGRTIYAYEQSRRR